RSTRLLDDDGLAAVAQAHRQAHRHLDLAAGGLADEHLAGLLAGGVGVVVPAAPHRIAAVGAAHVGQVLRPARGGDTDVDLAVVDVPARGPGDGELAAGGGAADLADGLGEPPGQIAAGLEDEGRAGAARRGQPLERGPGPVQLRRREHADDVGGEVRRAGGPAPQVIEGPLGGGGGGGGALGDHGGQGPLQLGGGGGELGDGDAGGAV